MRSAYGKYEKNSNSTKYIIFRLTHVNYTPPPHTPPTHVTYRWKWLVYMYVNCA